MSENKISSFIASIREAERDKEANAALRNSHVFRNGTIEDIRNKYKECAASKVFLALYRDGIPTDEDTKILYADNLDQKMAAYIESAGESSVYEFLSKAGKNGAKPAANLISKVDTYVDDTIRKFYNEEEYSPDELETAARDTDSDTPDIVDIANKIKSDMDLEQVSGMIEGNVKATIANEIKISKEEEEKINELEASLQDDEAIVNEEALEMAYIKAGYKPNELYKPSLFNGIMIGEMNKLITEDCSDETKQKKAFFESCKEMTVLQTLQTFGIIDINPRNVQRYADKYATGY